MFNMPACPSGRTPLPLPPSLPFPESNKSTKEFNWTATAAPAQDEVSGRTITPNVGVSFVIRQSNIPGAKHCIDYRCPPAAADVARAAKALSVKDAAAVGRGRCCRLTRPTCLPPSRSPLSTESRDSRQTHRHGWAGCQTWNSPHGNRYASIIAKSWGNARSIHHKWKWM